MDKYRLDNPENNPYIAEANALIDKHENNTRAKGLSFHHIIPRSFRPDLTDDPKNHV